MYRNIVITAAANSCCLHNLSLFILQYYPHMVNRFVSLL